MLSSRADTLGRWRRSRQVKEGCRSEPGYVREAGCEADQRHFGSEGASAFVQTGWQSDDRSLQSTIEPDTECCMIHAELTRFKNHSRTHCIWKYGENTCHECGQRAMP